MDIKGALSSAWNKVTDVATNDVAPALEKAAPYINPVGTAVANAVADHFSPAPAPGVNPPSPPPPPAAPDPLRNLDPAQAGKLRDAMNGNSGPAAQALARAAVAQASVLPEAQATKLLNVAAMNPAGPEGAAALKTITSPAWLRADPSQKAQLLNVMTTASPRGLDALANLSQGDKLFSTDAKGGTLLKNLDTMATQDPNPNFSPARKQELLDDVMVHTNNPGTINQSVDNTCTVTTMEYELARKQPAEFARVMAGLGGPNGTVQLAGGATMPLKDGALAPRNGDNRSFASKLFQASAMELGNGSDVYNPATDTSKSVGGKSRAGLKEPEEAALATQLFNTPGYQNYPFRSGPNAKMQDTVIAGLRNYDVNNPSSPPVILNFDVGNKMGHAVAFVKVDGDRVYFRNPYGASNTSNVPGARVEDPSTGLESMSIADFKKNCDSYSARVS